MRKDAELHAEEDKKKQELIEARNIADALIYTSEKTLKDGGEKVNPEMKKDVEEKIETLKKAKESDNIEEIKSNTQTLSETIQKVGAELHKEAPKAEGTNKGSNETKENNDNAEEGKYTEK